MSYVRPQIGGETRRPRGGIATSCYEVMTNPKTYRPFGEGAERRTDVAHERAMIHYLHGEQKLPLPPRRNWSPGWEDRRQPPSRRNPSPGWEKKKQLPSRRSSSPGWHDERPLADSDTLPARWQNELLPAKQRTREEINHRQPTGKGPKAHFQRSVERRQKTPEDSDDEEEEALGSSPHNSVGGSLTIVEKYERQPEFSNRELSHSFDVIEDEWAGTGDEDGYVHIPQGSPRVGTLDREKLSREM